jgi:hypothetical protein
MSVIKVENENEYQIKVLKLIEQLSKIKNIINFKRVVIYETEIENFSKEMDLSYESSKKIITSVYLEDLLSNIYNDTYQLIEILSQTLLEEFEPEDYYVLKGKEYFLLFQKSYN